MWLIINNVVQISTMGLKISRMAFTGKCMVVSLPHLWLSVNGKLLICSKILQLEKKQKQYIPTTSIVCTNPTTKHLIFPYKLCHQCINKTLPSTLLCFASFTATQLLKQRLDQYITKLKNVSSMVVPSMQRRIEKRLVKCHIELLDQL